jgi:mannose-6-phosphate isomerase
MGKTEMWYIVAAEPGAELVYGLANGVDKSAFAEAVKAGKTDEVLHRVAVKKGDVFFIPSGLIHAIGAGILIAEIQQNSDLTYRVYDYDRRDADGNLRELHVAKALDVVRPYTEEEITAIRYSEAEGEIPEGLLADCSYFRVEKNHASESKPIFMDEAEQFCSLLFVEGEGSMTVHGENYHVKKGDSWFIPAGTPCVRICGDTDFLLATAK